MSKSNAAPTDSDRTIILLRHGIAEERSADGKDETRRLTTEGRARMREAARGLAELFPKVDTIYTSPLLRAVETAQAVAKAYGTKANINTTDVLAPGSDAKAFRALLDETPHRRAIYVGHEPTLTSFFLALLGIRNPKGAIELKKGGGYVVPIAADGAASLELVLSPRVLRRLGKR
ncbi:MAG TPA: phosphohistidine phosphatase SixA [Thermoanaerobaculia bacterium]|nr:phosphohistidine phosphatase SixA [Thermoanaerobaculia bacterium]